MLKDLKENHITFEKNGKFDAGTWIFGKGRTLKTFGGIQNFGKNGTFKKTLHSTIRPHIRRMYKTCDKM